MNACPNRPRDFTFWKCCCRPLEAGNQGSGFFASRLHFLSFVILLNYKSTQFCYRIVDRKCRNRSANNGQRNVLNSVADFQKLDIRRRQLGMSRASLARRAKVSLPTIHRILTGKEAGPSVSTIEAIASALGMAVQIVETIDAEELRERQAKQRAARLVGMVQGTMGLESQTVDPKAIETLTKRNVNRLLAGSGRRLWDE